MEWPLLASLPDTEREELLATTRRRSYRRGDLLVREGEPADSLHLVESGRLAVTVATTEGEHATLNILAPGDYFGELSLLDGMATIRTATVLALEPATTRSLSAAAFQQLRQRHRGAEQLLLVLLARRVEELSGRLLEAMYDDLDRRVARRLTDLTRVYAAGRPDPVEVPLTQDQLADLVGGTRPSVNQVLQRLAAEGALRLGRGRITVLDRDRLDRDRL